MKQKFGFSLHFNILFKIVNKNNLNIISATSDQFLVEILMKEKKKKKKGENGIW